MTLPPLKDVNPHMSVVGNVWKVAVGVGPMYIQCDDLTINLAARGLGTIEAALARRVARGVVLALSPSEPLWVRLSLNKRYLTEMKQVKAWREVAEEISDWYTLKSVMEQ